MAPQRKTEVLLAEEGVMAAKQAKNNSYSPLGGKDEEHLSLREPRGAQVGDSTLHLGVDRVGAQ